MSGGILTPPKPVPVTLQPFTPHGIIHPMTPNKNKLVRRTKLSKTDAIFEKNQTIKRKLFDYPKAEMEETDINDLFFETRERCIVEIIRGSSGDEFILFDDGTYEMRHTGFFTSLNPNSLEHALDNVVENNE